VSFETVSTTSPSGEEAPLEQLEAVDESLIGYTLFFVLDIRPQLRPDRGSRTPVPASPCLNQSPLRTRGFWLGNKLDFTDSALIGVDNNFFAFFENRCGVLSADNAGNA
jgi:hypothetical protein